MSAEMDLMQRLAVSKKIMDRHSEIKRGDVRNTTPMVENFDTPQATYNLPNDLLQEQKSTPSNYDPSKPLEKEKILNSKLPDEIKRLMIEQPIVQPSSISGGVTLSDDIIEGATRLMGKNNKISEQPKQIINVESTSRNNNQTSNININEIKNIIRDVVRDTVKDVVREELKEAGMIIESTQTVNESLQFKVGNTVFVGKIIKVKKLEK
jgi:hypothetical protein